MREKTIELIKKLSFHILLYDCTLTEAAIAMNISKGYASRLLSMDNLIKVRPKAARLVRDVIESHPPYPGILVFMHLNQLDDGKEHSKIIMFPKVI